MNAQRMMARPAMMPALRGGNALPDSGYAQPNMGTGIMGATAPSGGARISRPPEPQAVNGADVNAAMQAQEQRANQMNNQAKGMAPGMLKDMATAAAKREMDGINGYRQAGAHVLFGQGRPSLSSVPVGAVMQLQADMANAASRMGRL